MMMIAGNLGNDAELKTSPKGDAITSFSVAVSKGRDTPTTWFRCTIWGKRGETLKQYLTKGSKVSVAGEFAFEEWEKDGKKGNALKIRVSEITLQGGGAAGSGSRPAAGGSDDFGPPPAGDDDIPFLRPPRAPEHDSPGSRPRRAPP